MGALFTQYAPSNMGHSLTADKIAANENVRESVLSGDVLQVDLQLTLPLFVAGQFEKMTAHIDIGDGEHVFGGLKYE